MLTGKGGAVDGPACRAVAVDDVAALDHELCATAALADTVDSEREGRTRAKKREKSHVGIDTMEIRVGVAIAVLARRELAEVAGGARADGVVEMEDDAADVDTLDFNVELDTPGG